MVEIIIDEDACVGCGSCVDDCMACLSCHEICPAQAMTHKDIHVAKRLYIDRRVNHILERII